VPIYTPAGSVELLGLVLCGLLVRHRHLEVGGEGHGPRGGGGGEPDGARDGADASEAQVEQDGAEQQLLRHVGGEREARERLLVLDGAHADLELTLLHGAQRLLKVGHLSGLADRHVDIVGVEPGGGGEDAQVLLELGALGLLQREDEGLGELGQVVVLVEPLADAVDGREGAEDEGEGGGEAEDLLLRQRLQVGAEGWG